MIAKIYSAIPDGFNGHIIEVESSSTKSLPTFNIVGMATKIVSEARERVRSAIVSSDLQFPDKKVTINLAPAELPKDGSQLDLPIALAILAVSNQLKASELEKSLFVGELSLDGKTRPIRGIINIVEAAKTAGFTEVFVPQANLSQAMLIRGVTIYGVDNLLELFLHLKGIKPITPSLSEAKVVTHTYSPPAHTSNVAKPRYTPNTDTLDDIRGQDLAKRALIVAIAGHHNLLLSGPPGAGKTMLAKTAANLLPPISLTEQIAVTKLYSLSGLTHNIVEYRPFRAPHHTASPASIIGGGSYAQPGEISLANHGILFLDELPEYARSVLEALRQPLEDRQITITRANQRSTYPANFMLIATMNPCPCGFLNDPHKECTCTTGQITAYQRKISGPILDRIDLIVKVERVNNAKLASYVKNTKTEKAKDKHYIVKNTETEVEQPSQALSPQSEHSRAQYAIQNALTMQERRFQSNHTFNSDLSSREISVYVKMTQTAQDIAKSALDTLNLSARSYFKTLKVARTIADLAASEEVLPEHISEALSFRHAL